MQNIYTDQTYLQNNPTWDEEDSPWKAKQIIRIIEKNQISIRSVADIGCGFGGIINCLYEYLPSNIEFNGYDIAPEAIAYAKKKERERLQFHEEDLLKNDKTFDLLLAVDVFEHVSDYYGFLDGCRRKASFKIYHIPLDIHASSVVRASLLNARKSVGHIHYFTSETALASLTDTGHEIIDFFYTDGGIVLTHLHPSLKRTVANIPRRILSLLSIKWTARLLGGYSLLVLCK